MSAQLKDVPFDWSEAIEILEAMLEAETAPSNAASVRTAPWPVPAAAVAASTPRLGAPPGTAPSQTPPLGPPAAANAGRPSLLGAPAALACQTGPRAWAMEASALGWRPGAEAPAALTTDIGRGRVFIRHGTDVFDGEVRGWRYRTRSGLHLLVVND